MTIMPLSPSLCLRSSLSPNLPTITAAVRSLGASLPHTTMAEYIDPNSKDAPQTLTNYPKPISPPLPAISKHIEQSRAMSASSRSSLFSLCRSDILFEDQWLMAVNKPQGVYCETILLSVSRMVDDSDGHGNGLACVLLCVSFCGSLLILWKNWWGLEDSEVLTNSVS